MAQLENLVLGRQTKHRKHIRFFNLVSAKADELVQRGLGIAHAALRPASDGLQRGFIDLHVFQFRDMGEMFGDKR